MEQLMVVLVLLAWVGLLVTLVQTRMLMPAARVPGIGRILFLSLASLKLWVALFLGYILLGSLVGGVPREYRLYLNALFALYLVVQPVGVNVALWRWKRNDGHGVQPVAGKAPRLPRKVRIATRRFARACRKVKRHVLRLVRGLRR